MACGLVGKRRTAGAEGCGRKSGRVQRPVVGARRLEVGFKSRPLLAAPRLALEGEADRAADDAVGAVRGVPAPFGSLQGLEAVEGVAPPLPVERFPGGVQEPVPRGVGVRSPSGMVDQAPSAATIRNTVAVMPTVKARLRTGCQLAT